MASNVKIFEGDIYSSVDADVICIPLSPDGLEDKRLTAFKRKEKDAYNGYKEDISTISADALLGNHFICNRGGREDKYISVLYCRVPDSGKYPKTDFAALESALQAVVDTATSWRGGAEIKTIAIALDAVLDGKEAITIVREFFFDKPFQVEIYWSVPKT